jgi:DNA-binding beta-propeller fold protein YncE
MGTRAHEHILIILRPNNNILMKKILSIAVIAGMISVSCQTSKKTEETAAGDTTTVAVAKAPVTLTKKWETEAVLTTCESVIYDKANDILYVANINGAPDGKDGNGFISKVSLDGKVTQAEWVKGMDAPKGMGIANGKLYVTDIDRVHEIDIATGKIVKTHLAQGAKFLNDITVDGTGKVYVSDSGGGTISVIENGKLTKWIENLQGPNGVFAEGNEILTVLWEGKTFNTIDPSTKQLTVKTDGIENGDGIEAIGNGEYLVSSWNGMINHISADWKKTLVLDTRADSVNAADIEYIQEKNLLLVPTFFKNKVVAYDLSK